MANRAIINNSKWLCLVISASLLSTMCGADVVSWFGTGTDEVEPTSIRIVDPPVGSDMTDALSEFDCFVYVDVLFTVMLSSPVGVVVLMGASDVVAMLVLSVTTDGKVVL